MNSRPPSPVSPRPETTTTNLLLQPSTSGWYAAWKARKGAAAPTPAVEPAAPPDAAEALARWLKDSPGK